MALVVEGLMARRLQIMKGKKGIARNIFIKGGPEMGELNRHGFNKERDKIIKELDSLAGPWCTIMETNRFLVNFARDVRAKGKLARYKASWALNRGVGEAMLARVGPDDLYTSDEEEETSDYA